MRKDIEFIGTYTLNNPFVSAPSFRENFMRHAFTGYKKIRLTLKNIIPLSKRQQYLWESRDPFANNRSNRPTIWHHEDAEPFFQLNCICFMELIPKENIPLVVKQLKRLQKKHGDFYFAPSCGLSQLEENTIYGDGGFRVHLNAFTLRENDKLSDFAQQINFRIIGLSSSFACLVISAYMSEQLTNKLSKYAVTNIEDKEYLSGYDELPWYHFSKLGYGTISGHAHKQDTINQVIQDAAWNIMKPITKTIRCMHFSSNKQLPPYVCMFDTNISGNVNEAFWSSLNVYNHICDYGPDGSYCIAWRNECPFFIYNKAHNTSCLESAIDVSILKSHLPDMLAVDSLCRYAASEVRTLLPRFTDQVLRSKKKLTKLLKLRTELDNKVYYSFRFLSEANSYTGPDYSTYFDSLIRSGDALYQRKITKNTNATAEKTCMLYTDACELLKNGINYRNEVHNHKLQRFSIGLSIVSLIVAIIAILVTIALDDNARPWLYAQIELIIDIFTTSSPESPESIVDVQSIVSCRFLC